MWTFQNNSEKTITDFKNTLNGVLPDDGSSTRITDQHYTGIRFNKTENSFLSLKSKEWFTLPENFSFEIWLHTIGNLGTFAGMVSGNGRMNSYSCNDNNFMLNIDDYGTFNLRYLDASGNCKVIQTSGIQSNSFYHIVLLHNQQDSLLYIKDTNKTLDTSFVLNIGSNWNPGYLTLGYTTSLIPGANEINSFVVYNNSLTVEQINGNFGTDGDPLLPIWYDQSYDIINQELVENETSVVTFEPPIIYYDDYDNKNIELNIILNETSNVEYFDSNGNEINGSDGTIINLGGIYSFKLKPKMYVEQGVVYELNYFWKILDPNFEIHFNSNKRMANFSIKVTTSKPEIFDQDITIWKAVETCSSVIEMINSKYQISNVPDKWLNLQLVDISNSYGDIFLDENCQTVPLNVGSAIVVNGTEKDYYANVYMKTVNDSILVSSFDIQVHTEHELKSNVATVSVNWQNSLYLTWGDGFDSVKEGKIATVQVNWADANPLNLDLEYYLILEDIEKVNVDTRMKGNLQVSNRNGINFLPLNIGDTINYNQDPEQNGYQFYLSSGENTYGEFQLTLKLVHNGISRLFKKNVNVSNTPNPMKFNWYSKLQNGKIQYLEDSGSVVNVNATDDIEFYIQSINIDYTPVTIKVVGKNLKFTLAIGNVVKSGEIQVSSEDVDTINPRFDPLKISFPKSKFESSKTLKLEISVWSDSDSTQIKGDCKLKIVGYDQLTKNGLSGGAIAGITISVIFVVILIQVLAVIWYRKKKNNSFKLINSEPNQKVTSQNKVTNEYQSSSVSDLDSDSETNLRTKLLKSDNPQDDVSENQIIISSDTLNNENNI
ncbi:chitin elicitor receptor kinase 1 [Anaeramoeba flamelloides]|uniref:Chitin elicitor receptor kinase 1 n=1 Tax=Anaeramoeba flamelloides TaxID=1746091 RepID=A0ABQ8Y762_9EUKA|nr:chitin elicitor receptor kinase 1 [Anaeramoeba flamelloides]